MFALLAQIGRMIDAADTDQKIDQFFNGFAIAREGRLTSLVDLNSLALAYERYQTEESIRSIVGIVNRLKEESKNPEFNTYNLYGEVADTFIDDGIRALDLYIATCKSPNNAAKEARQQLFSFYQGASNK